MITINVWYEWLKRTIFVGGILFWGFFGLMQLGVGVTINLPTIEHTFKQAKN